MIKHGSVPWMVGVILGVAAGLPQPAAAQRAAAPAPARQAEAALQESPIRIRKMEWQGRRAMARTPQYQSSAAQGVAIPKEWWVMTVDYDLRPPDNDAFIDGLAFHYFILAEGQGPDGRKAFSFYRTRVDYIDIEGGRGRRSTVFLRPNTVKRFGMPVAAAVQIEYRGQMVAQETETTMRLPDAWWTDPRVVEAEGVTLREGYLLNRQQTPFALTDADLYETIR